MQARHRLVAPDWPASCAIDWRDKRRRWDESVKGLRLKSAAASIAAAKHHVADIGFYGNSRNVNGYTVPHFQVMLGGKFKENAAATGRPLARSPARRSRKSSSACSADSSKNARAKLKPSTNFCNRPGKERTEDDAR